MQRGEGICFSAPEPRLGRKRQVTIQPGLGCDSSLSGKTILAGTLTPLKWGSVPPQRHPWSGGDQQDPQPSSLPCGPCGFVPEVFSGPVSAEVPRESPSCWRPLGTRPSMRCSLFRCMCFQPWDTALLPTFPGRVGTPEVPGDPWRNGSVSCTGSAGKDEHNLKKMPGFCSSCWNHSCGRM